MPPGCTGGYDPGSLSFPVEALTDRFSRAIKRLNPREGAPAKRSLTRAKTLWGAEARIAHPPPCLEGYAARSAVCPHRGNRHALTARRALARRAQRSGGARSRTHPERPSCRPSLPVWGGLLAQHTGAEQTPAIPAVGALL